MGMPQRSTSEVVIVTNMASNESITDINAIAAAEKSVGRKLAAVRDAKGLSREDVFKGTKVKLAHIAAIEMGDRASLPATPYTAGFIKAYAQFLGLDPNAYAAAYRAEIAGLPAPPIAAEAAATAEVIIDRPTPTATIISATPPAAPTPSSAAASLPAIIVATSDATLIAEPTPAAPVAETSSRADKFVTYAGVGFTLFFALIIGAQMMSRNSGDVQTPTPSQQIAAAPVEPVSAQSSPAKVELTAPVADEQAATSPVSPEGATLDNSPAALATGEPSNLTPVADASELFESTPVPIVAIAPPIRKPAPVIIERTPAPVLVAPEPMPEFATAAPGIANPVEIAPPSSIVVEAKLLKASAPKYPDKCDKRAKDLETVKVEFDVTAEGRPTAPRVLNSSNSCFDAAAIDSAYAMRFAPRTVEGSPVMQQGVTANIRFTR